MAIDLKKIGDIQTLSLGYTHEATVDASVFSGSTGAQALAFNVAGAGLAGTVGKCAIIVDQLVTAAVTDGGVILNNLLFYRWIFFWMDFFGRSEKENGAMII